MPVQILGPDEGPITITASNTTVILSEGNTLPAPNTHNSTAIIEIGLFDEIQGVTLQIDGAIADWRPNSISAWSCATDLHIIIGETGTANLIRFTGPETSLTNYGTISVGVHALGSQSEISNFGTIKSWFSALYLGTSDNTPAYLHNDGLIEGRQTAISCGPGYSIVENSGTIVNRISLGVAGHLELINSGEILTTYETSGATAIYSHGGQGHDILAGSQGADIFQFNRFAGRDRILDWQGATDRLDLTALAITDPADITAAIGSNGVDATIDLAPLGGFGAITILGGADTIDITDFIL